MKTVLLSCAAVLALATSASAATIVNGSFENPVINDNWGTYYAGSTEITGWTVGGRGVDLIDFYWEGSDGDQSLDMSAGGAGSVSQSITNLVVGERYRPTFDMSANPAGREVMRDMQVSVGTQNRNYAYDTAMYGPTRNDMQWVGRNFFFTATATEELLTFKSLENTPYGAALDNVAIAAVPLPASVLLLGLGVAGLGAARRTRKG